jgi:hypothetical protein
MTIDGVWFGLVIRFIELLLLIITR